ncbi:MAG: nicotinate-nucleotide adenylyltransferase [Lachnospiraceae bacterium]|nr:nicotinate-nucleotide adenylyltransferase [Lachnospiraceae bacterium]
MEQKRIGIMGGTFNPIHFGHLLLAEQARDSFGLDQILFIPSGHPYMKEQQMVTDRYLRLEMTRLAICENPFFQLSDMEVKRQGPSYTFQTLADLKEQSPETDFYFIAGADSIFDMEKWKQPAAIFRDCTVLAAVRDQAVHPSLEKEILRLQQQYKARIETIPMKEVGISSTDIRNRLKEGRSIRYMVPDQVIAYIEKNHLYRENESGKESSRDA